LGKCDEEEYYYCNENWYFTILQAIYIIIQGVSNPDDRTEKLKTLIETFIFRKTENIYSFLKDMMPILILCKNVHKDKGSRRYRIW